MSKKLLYLVNVKMPPAKGRKYAARDQELLDRYTTKKDYKDSLNKKIKDFTKEEKSIYNRIAQQEKRNPYGQELSSSSTFVEGVPFAPPEKLSDIKRAVEEADDDDALDPRKMLRSRRPKKTAVRQVVEGGTDPLTLREQDVVDDPLQETVVETPVIPTVADLRSLLREAGALDRTPPQQHFTPLALSVPDYQSNPELAPKEGLPIREALNRRRERIAADEQARVINTENKLSQFNVDLRMDKEAGLKSSLISALGVIGDRSRKDLAEREYPRLRAQGASDAEARAAIAEGIIDVDREPKSISNTRKLEYDEYMSGQGGALLKGLERFNIPTDMRALKQYKKITRKQAEMEGGVDSTRNLDWFNENTPMPQSPREKRIDLQLGLDDPEDLFDPTPLAPKLREQMDISLLSSDEDESFDTDEYVREDVREALLRDKRIGEREVSRFLEAEDDLKEDEVRAAEPQSVIPYIPEEADFGAVDDIGFDFEGDFGDEGVPTFGYTPTTTDAQDRLAAADLERAREGRFDTSAGMRPSAPDGLSLDEQMDLMLRQRQAETTQVGNRSGQALNTEARAERLRREALPKPSEILTETTSLRQEQAAAAISAPPTINPWREGTREHARFSNNPTVNLTYPPNVFSEASVRDQSGFGNYVLDNPQKIREAQELAAQRASSLYIPDDPYVAPSDYAGLSVDNPIDLTSFVPLEIAQPQAQPQKPRINIRKKKKIKKMIKEDEIRTAALLPEDRREVIDLTGFTEEPVVRSGVSRVDTSGSKVDASGNVRKFKPSGGGGRRGARKKKVVAKKAVVAEPTVRMPDGDQGFSGGGNDPDPHAGLIGGGATMF